MIDKNELFPKDADFSKLVKKARRKSLVRNILVSIVVSSLLFTALFWLGTFLMYKKIDKEISYDYATQVIQGANVEVGGSLFNNTPFSVSVITDANKFVAGVPIPWENQEKVFSIFGSTETIQSTSVSGIRTIDDERTPLYFQGERIVEFYSPNVNYDFVPDDRPLLGEIDDSQVVEMAFSFDAPYSIEEVQDTFWDQVNWYWVDTHESGDQEPIFGNNAYGFQLYQDSLESATGFIEQIKWLQEEKGDFQQEATRIYDVITENGEMKVEPKNIKITGVVVTGTAEELKQFNDVPMIRAAVLGATADKY